MVAGDVILWEHFSLHRLPGEDKNRWFVYLGDNGSYACPHILFVITPTTQFEDFEPGACRGRRKVVRFDPSPDSPFALPCLIDVEFDYFDVPAEHLNDCKGHVTIKGRLSHAHVKAIWQIIKGSSRYSQMVKKDISRCLGNAGYPGISL